MKDQLAHGFGFLWWRQRASGEWEITGPTHAQQAAQQAACGTGRPTKAAARAWQLPTGWLAAVLLDKRAPSAVYRPSPHVYKNALTLGSMTWQCEGKKEEVNTCHRCQQHNAAASP